jgi:hypothetical protein
MDQLHAKSGCLYIIGCLLRPGALTFATDLEHTYFPPDTETNDLYNIFQLQYHGMPYYIIEIPQSQSIFKVIEELSKQCKLKLVNGKPSSTEGDSFGLLCSAEACYTLEASGSPESTDPMPTQLRDEQALVRERLKMTETDIHNE